MGAYREPAFAFDALLHDYGEASRLSILAGIEDPNATDAGLFRIVDSQHSRPAQIKAVVAGAIDIELDRLVNSSPNSTRLIIPEGHNLDGWGVRVLGGVASPAGNAVSTVESVTGTDRIDFTWDEDPDGALRFQLVRFDSSPANDLTIDLPEIYLTNTVTPTRGPDTSWGATVRKKTTSLEGAAGVGTTIRTGPDRQQWTLKWNALLAPDITGFVKPLEAAVRPFWFLPPDDDFDWGLYQLVGDAVKKEKFRVATNGDLIYELVTVVLLEVLG